MDKLALKLPGSYEISNPPGLSAGKFTNLSGFVSEIFVVIIYISAFLAFYFFIWGAFNYIMAQGQKENLAKAKERIRWALIGLIVVLLSYTLARFIGEIFPPGKGGLPF